MTPKELKTLQARLGLTNQQMADELCCSRVMVEKMKSGERKITERMEKLIRLVFREATWKP